MLCAQLLLLCAQLLMLCAQLLMLCAQFLRSFSVSVTDELQAPYKPRYSKVKVSQLTTRRPYLLTYRRRSSRSLLVWCEANLLYELLSTEISSLLFGATMVSCQLHDRTVV